MIRVLLADDHRLFRDGIRAILQRTKEIEVIGEARDGFEAVTLSKELTPHIILMDIIMPKLNGLKATECIRSGQPDVNVLFLTMSDDAAFVRKARALGAKGFLSKKDSYADVITAIYAIYNGREYFPSD